MDPYQQNASFQRLSHFSLFLPLPTTDTHSPKVVLLRNTSDVLTEKLFHDQIKAQLLVVDVLLNEEESVYVNGAVVVEDLKGLRTQNFLAMSPSILRRLLILAQVRSREN